MDKSIIVLCPGGCLVDRALEKSEYFVIIRDKFVKYAQKCIL